MLFRLHFLLIFMILFLLLRLAFSQSIKKQYDSKQAEMQLYQILDSAKSIKNSDPDHALNVVIQGLDLADLLNKDLDKARLLHLKGVIEFNLGKSTQAIHSLNNALKLSKKCRSYTDAVNIAGNLGMVYEKHGQIKNALSIYFETLKLIGQSNDDGKAIILNNIGNLYFHMGHLTSAKIYFEQGKSIFEQSNNPNQLGSIYINLGNVFKVQQNFDSAYFYYNQAAVIFERVGNRSELAALYSNLGALYTDYQKYEEALKFYNKSLQHYQTIKHPVGEAEVLNNIGAYYHNQQQYKEAIDYLLRAEKLAFVAHSSSLLADIYYNLSSAYEEKGELNPALTYAQQYADLKDTLFTQESNRLISEMRQKYEAEKSEKEIEQLKTEKSLQLSKVVVRTQQRNIIILAAGIILVLLSFAVYGYRQKLKQNNLKAKQDIDDLLKEQDIKYISAVILGQEQERQRVAEDLHDRLGSLLSTIKLNFSGLERKMDVELYNTAQYKTSIHLLDEACNEVRTIAYNMASSNLHKYGFVTSIEELKNSIESSGKLKMNLHIQNIDTPVDEETEINLYRITQEIISNILRHAGASEINLYYDIIDKYINLLVEDNGSGFDLENSRNGMGIRNMQIRVDKLGGNISIDSAIGRGTTIVITVPVQENAFFKEESGSKL